MKICELVVICVCVINDIFGDKIIQTNSGKIRGKLLKVLNNDIYAYLGIPYAKAPIGELRFKEPQPVLSWTEILNATTKSPICMQDPIFPEYEWVPPDLQYMSEDCLYLNVWVPALKGECKPLSTMVWIHGGAFNTGSANMDVHDGRFLASVGNVIVISLNYRLGVFGFSNFNNNTFRGNMGILDEIMALKWIHQNIENFEGDKKDITLFGFSAGSMFITHNMISSGINGLFKRAIFQSGSNFAPVTRVDPLVNFRSSEAVAINAGCGSEESCLFNEAINCLQNIDPFKLAAAEKALMKHRSTFLSFFPQLDNKYVKNPTLNLDDEIAHNIEVMVVTVPNEGSPFFGLLRPQFFKQDYPFITKGEAEFILSKLFNVSGPILHIIVEEYIGMLSDDDYSGIARRTIEAVGDGFLSCAIEALAEKLSGKLSTVYYFLFNHAPTKAMQRKWEGVPHFSDIYFVFGMPFMFPRNFTDDEKEFSMKIMQMWTSFAKTGKPFYPDQDEEWLTFDTQQRNAIELKLGKFSNYKAEAKKECKLWKKLYRKL